MDIVELLEEIESLLCDEDLTPQETIIHIYELLEDYREYMSGSWQDALNEIRALPERTV